MVGGRFSKRKTDGDHPFGLYRAKYLASFVGKKKKSCFMQKNGKIQNI